MDSARLGAQANRLGKWDRWMDWKASWSQLFHGALVISPTLPSGPLPTMGNGDGVPVAPGAVMAVGTAGPEIGGKGATGRHWQETGMQASSAANRQYGPVC
jgi:hypothetical protein